MPSFLSMSSCRYTTKSAVCRAVSTLARRSAAVSLAMAPSRSCHAHERDGMQVSREMKRRGAEASMMQPQAAPEVTSQEVGFESSHATQRHTPSAPPRCFARHGGHTAPVNPSFDHLAVVWTPLWSCPPGLHASEACLVRTGCLPAAWYQAESAQATAWTSRKKPRQAVRDSGLQGIGGFWCRECVHFAESLEEGGDAAACSKNKKRSCICPAQINPSVKTPGRKGGGVRSFLRKWWCWAAGFRLRLDACTAGVYEAGAWCSARQSATLRHHACIANQRRHRACQSINPLRHCRYERWLPCIGWQPPWVAHRSRIWTGHGHGVCWLAELCWDGCADSAARLLVGHVAPGTAPAQASMLSCTITSERC